VRSRADDGIKASSSSSSSWTESRADRPLVAVQVVVLGGCGGRRRDETTTDARNSVSLVSAAGCENLRRTFRENNLVSTLPLRGGAQLSSPSRRPRTLARVSAGCSSLSPPPLSHLAVLRETISAGQLAEYISQRVPWRFRKR